jgi:PAS domain S-box-containing protein
MISRYAGACIMGSPTEFHTSHEPTKNNGKTQRSRANETDRSSLQHCSPESAEYFALAGRATNDALRDWDVKSGRLAWPQGLESLLGYTSSIVSQDIGFWQRHLHPDDRARVSAGIRDALAGAERWSGEYRFRRADGSYALLLERAHIVRDEAGDAVRFVGSMLDITARKQLQDQLLRSQKMEAFGQLAGGVAHDFNNFLTTIIGYSDLVLRGSGVKGQLAAHITEIRNAADRAAALTGQLLAFSRQHPLDARVLEVNTLITNLERSLLRLLGENITVQCELHRFRDGGYIKVDRTQMTQIILNLAVNARDAMPDGGHLTVASGVLRIDADNPMANGADAVAPGEYITISVIDSGVGMSEEAKAHLFEPFFTTKENAHGSGLGLATSYGIVRQSGGHMAVKSERGCGTTVTIYVPKVPPPAPSSYKKPTAKNIPNGTETVLVLEDDIAVRHISVRVLRSLGYNVLEAANCDDAQRLIQESGGKIHLLLTDIVMPQMSGRHFAERVCKASPHTKVVFISGYLDESLGALDPDGAAMFFLPKPFDTEQLARKVREALDA